jgi:hypothetical protein
VTLSVEIANTATDANSPMPNFSFVD